MANLERSVATLRIMGDELVPEEISRLLSAVPTSAHAKGHQFPSGPAGRIVTRQSGMWRLRAKEAEPENLDGQVSELLGQVTCDLSVWNDIATRFRVDLFCGWFMGSGNEGVEISPKTMLALAQRGIQLSLDIYGPEASDGDGAVSPA
jgi:hypothetical protein